MWAWGARALGCKRCPTPAFASTSQDASSRSKGPSNMSVERSRSLFKLCCAHHKNSGRGFPGFEVVTPIPKLHALLVVYEGSSRGFLLCHAEGLDPEVDVSTTLFFYLTTSLQLFPEQLDNCFRDVQVKHDLPLAQPMPQSTLRIIFKLNRREHPSLPGPSDAGAVVGMGNPPKICPFHFLGGWANLLRQVLGIF